MFRRLLTLFSVAALGFMAVPAHAQETTYGAPAHVAFVDGTAALEREGRTETSALNMPLLSGDRLRTADGRVEVLFDDGSALHLDEHTTVDVQSDNLLRLIDGRLRLNLTGPSRQVDYRIDSAPGSVRITQAGEYRIALLHGDRETQLELAVIRGSADISTEQGATTVRAGERAYASEGLAPSYPYAYNSANWDAFDQWSEARRDQRLGVSSEYLPASMQPYAPTFDQYGDWRYAQPYGYVWYPRVAAGWRPYYYGRWISYPRYGWTWVGLDHFAWPTHHYGRWGFAAGAWFWIPGNVWAPAYVSWAYAPGYVSWCPLGFNNLPVVAINVNFNHFHSPWHAWTVVNAAHFGGVFVNQRAVFVDHLAVAHRPVFVSRPAAPVVRDVAVPRGSVPIRWAGGRSVPGDNYFTRGGVGGDHILTPAAPGVSRRALPAPDRAERVPDVSAQRATARGAQSPAFGVAPGQRTAADDAVRRTGPRAGDNPAYAPRAAAPYAPYDRRAVGRDPAPGAIAPRQTVPMRPMDRGDVAVPRGAAEPRSQNTYRPPAYPPQAPPARVAPPPQAAPAPAPQRSAPAERSRPSGSRSTGQATARQGGGRGGR